MKVSSRTQLGLQILCYLTLRYGGDPVQTSELAAVTGTTEKYIGQIMLTLRASPLVLSSRGAQGGYYLSRSPGEISLLEAVQALEGEILEFEAPSGCQAQEVLDRALEIIRNLLQTSLVKVLESRTLEDLARESQHFLGFSDWVI